MPPPAAQHAAPGHQFTATLVVVRLLTPFGLPYAEAVRRYAPYNRLVQPLPQMRKEALALIQQAVAEHRPIYVLVNNRAEGNAPLTIQALADALLLPDPAAEPAAAG